MLTKGLKTEDPECGGGIPPPLPSKFNVFSRLSLADPQPLSPTLRWETGGGAWPLAKVNRALNCVWALHRTPTTAEIKRASSPSSHWQLWANKTVSLLPLPCLPWAVSSPQQTRSDFKPSTCETVRANQFEPSHIHHTFRSWIFEAWWLIGACLTNALQI